MFTVTHIEREFIRVKGTERVEKVIGIAEGARWCVKCCPGDASLRGSVVASWEAAPGRRSEI